MKKIALSHEQMHYLKKIGIDISNASMCYNEIGLVAIDGELKPDDIPTYTLQDIIDKLPSAIYDEENNIEYVLNIGKYMISYEDINDIESNLKCICDVSDDLLTIAFKMLIWCKEHNYIVK